MYVGICLLYYKYCEFVCEKGINQFGLRRIISQFAVRKPQSFTVYYRQDDRTG